MNCGQPAPEPLPSVDGAAAAVAAAVPVFSCDDALIQWRQWGQGVFEDAARRQVPVLLYLAAPGSDGLFAAGEPAVRSLVEERFAAVQVNPYRRPDLVARYDPGGWPALLVLQTDGRVAAQAVDIPPRNVRMFLLRMVAHHRDRREVVMSKVEKAAGTAHLLAGYEIGAGDVYAAAEAAFDSVYGGFGQGVKFAEPLVLRFLLQYYRESGDPRARSMVRRSIQPFLSAPMQDEAAGGVWSYTHTPDWRTPRFVKSAAVQAGLLQLFLELQLLLDTDGGKGGAEYARAARRLLEFVNRELFDEDRGVFLARRVPIRCGSGELTGWTDPAAYADVNGLLVVAMIRAAAQLGDEEAARRATAAADFLLDELMTADGEVYHCLHEGRRYAPGILVNQMLVATALRAQYQLDDDERYLAGSEQALAWAESRLYDRDSGLFAAAPPTAIDGLVWPLQVRHRDTSLPSGNALAADLYLMKGNRQRAGQLLERLRLPTPPGRRHASYASSLLRYGEG
jgi:uncharacterized protein YyaL (SSP411 family)